MEMVRGKQPVYFEIFRSLLRLLTDGSISLCVQAVYADVQHSAANGVHLSDGILHRVLAAGHLQNVYRRWVSYLEVEPLHGKLRAHEELFKWFASTLPSM